MLPTAGLVAFALRQVSDDAADGLEKWIVNRFTDHTAALPRAVERAHGRAWEAVGLALGGDGLLQSLKDLWRDADLKAMRERVRAFLAATPTGLGVLDDAGKASALAEWQRLHKAKRFTLAGLHGPDLARAASGLSAASAPADFAAGAARAVASTADALRAEVPALSRVLCLAPVDGVPLLASAFLYFLRREIEQDEDLARGLTLDTLRMLGDQTRRGFAELESALEDRFAEVNRKLDELLARQPANPSPTAAFVISVTSEDELVQLRGIRDRLRGMPSGAVGADLWAKLGDAERAAGDFADAQASHTAAAEAARAAEDRVAEAAARFKAYRDACEASRWPEALASLRRAVELDPALEPFPFDRYEPLSLLGVGGFGAVFHCRDSIAEDDVAVKSLFDNDLDRAVSKVFAEAHALRKLSHPGIIGIREQTFADFKNKRRPYFVLEYFAGRSLEAVGKLAPDELANVLRPVAEAVAAAHAADILHRDLKPANILAAKGAAGWSTRVIDFGLAARPVAAARATVAAASLKQTKHDKSFSGTFRYAAPEQRGDLRGVEVGRYSDVYAFGKLCQEMLFGHLDVQDDDWDDLPEPWRGRWRKLTNGCLRREVAGPKARLAGFDMVLAEMRGWDARVIEVASVVSAPVAEVPPAPVVVPPPKRAPEASPVAPVPSSASVAEVMSAPVVPPPKKTPEAGDVLTVVIPEYDRPAPPGEQPTFLALTIPPYTPPTPPDGSPRELTLRWTQKSG